jgi:hypothetical protein
MDAIRLFLRSNSFRTSPIKSDLNSQPIPSDVINTDNQSNENDDVLTQRSSSSEKLSRDNVKTFLSTHPSSSSLSSRVPLTTSQLETCSGLSIPSSTNTKDTNIVASASASISNALSFTSNHYYKEYKKKRQRRHSWTGEHHHHISTPIRRTRSYRYPDRKRKHSTIHKYPTEVIRRKVIHANRSSKSVSFPLPSNINNQSSIAPTQIRSVKTTATNALLTAASLFKYWVHLLTTNGILLFFFSSLLGFFSIRLRETNAL